MTPRGGIYGDMYGDGQPVHPADDDCEDQGMMATKHCTMCVMGFDGNKKPIYPMLEKRWRYWCCSNCGLSYGENPHPDCH